MLHHGKLWLMALCALSVPAVAGDAYSDDTELFIYDFSKAGDYRPKVLVIFDNSGSMAETMELEREKYNPATVYPSLSRDPDTGNSRNYVYYSTDGSVPAINSNRRFRDSINACASSKTPLGTVGYFQSQVWTYVYSSYRNGVPRQGDWETISGENEDDITIVDCKQDIQNRNPANPFSGTLEVGSVGDGYPVDKTSNTRGEWYYTGNANDATSGSNTSVTLYTANYIRWYYGPTGYAVESRLRIAKDAVKSVISSTPGVDFGLAIFNTNNSTSTNGGRVVRRILSNDDMVGTITAEQNLLNTVEGLSATTNTPLCETLYEAYRFYGGQPVLYGKQGGTRDKLAEDPEGTYTSPYDKCSNNGYVIYVTDGAPTSDTDADSAVKALMDSLSTDERAAYGSTVGYGSGSAKSYLAAMAGYMKSKDVNTSSPGKQTVTTFTVGFGDEAISGAGNLLAETARRGGGQYYPAVSAEALTQALRSSLLAILRINTSLVSPAITTNNFDRTRSLNNIYYAMFEPDTGPRWKGNLKKLTLSGDGYVADVNGLPAIKADGSILEQAQTYWSSERDGNLVAKGGVQAMLAEKTNRNLYVVNSVASPKRLDAFNKANLVSIAGSADNLASYMQLASSTELDGQIDWTKGLDVDDEDYDGSTTIRPYIVGDPLHSRPLVVNYGCAIPSGQSTCTPDLRILMGTNAGFLHMFKDLGSTVDESWAMIPYELLPKQEALRLNAESADHLYGVDASPVALIKDANSNGVLKASEGDFVWLFFGLRAGGSSYYALDITNPDAPSLKWVINSQTTGFSLLGETWSVPEVAYVPWDASPSNKRLVMVFSGGYDANKSKVGIGSTDSKGMGLYMVDADSGALVFSATPGTGSSTNKQVTGMVDSMPGPVSTLDSDGDGRTDRIYAGDTGGNIWRLDMPSTSTSAWSVFKFASLGSDDVQANDRRFFTQPVVVRTINKQVTKMVISGEDYFSFKERAFDAVLIGSGDRNRPSSESTVQNAYFMLRDYGVVAKNYNTGAPAPITMTDLYDVSVDPLAGVTATNDLLSLRAAITSKSGWKYWLAESGEKSMGAGVVLQGKLYFTSFLPQVQSFEECTIQSIGAMRQYMVDMHYGTSFKYVVDQDGNETPQRYVEVNNKVADDLVIHAGDDSKIRIIGGAPGEEVILKDEGEGVPERCTGEGECSEGADEAEMDMTPKKIYLYEDEPQ